MGDGSNEEKTPREMKKRSDNKEEEEALNNVKGRK